MNLNEEIIKVCFKIAKRSEGALIVIGDCDYKPLVEQVVTPFSIIENPKLLESLALMDGAVIIDKFGIMKAYGVMLKVNKLSMLKNFGTRHQSGLSASMNEGNTAYVVSEEDNKVRIFREGKLILEIDGRQKNIEKNIPKIGTILETIGIGTIGSVGTTVLIPSLGLAIIPGVIIFGGAYYLINKIKEWK